jgi:hypothetical protein
MVGIESLEAFLATRPVGVEVIEKQDRREQVRDGAIRSSFARHALILTPSSTHCAINHCDSLGKLLRDTLVFTQVHGASGSVPPAALGIVPDIVVLRISIDGDSRELVPSCRNERARAEILPWPVPASTGRRDGFEPR